MMTKLIGANWRTTLSALAAAAVGVLTILAALPYELGDVATIIPPAWKARVALVGVIAGFILKAINGTLQKDRSVTGGTVPNDPPAAGGDAKFPAPATLGLLVLLSVLPLLLLGGCGSLGADLSAAGTAYRRAVASQSFTANVDGKAQTVGVGTTLYFRDPDQGALPAHPVTAK